MLELIDRHGVTTSHMVPTQFHRMLALPEEVRTSYDVSSLRCMVHAAAPCPPDVKRRMIEWWGDSIMEYYAATEGGGTIVTAAEWMTKPGTVGKAWPGSEIRILDDEGQDVATGSEGTVYMSLALADFEYKGDAAKTAENRTAGFFTVGDWGLLDADGYLFLKDRKSDMIISGGVNIYPAEIEGELLTFPKIADVAVFGIPNEDWGEEIKAVVQPAGGRRARRRAAGRDPGLLHRAAGRLQAPEVDRLRRRAPARPERQALQAQAPRPLLGRPGRPHLITEHPPRPTRSLQRSELTTSRVVNSDSCHAPRRRAWPPMASSVSITYGPWCTSWPDLNPSRPCRTADARWETAAPGTVSSPVAS